MSSDKLFVVAIDFGTTYSGYAFSMRSNRSRTFTYNWREGLTQVAKTPTTILFTPRRDFHSFGHEAEAKYAELAICDENKDWYLFKRFKLTLYQNKNLNERTTIKDVTGKSMPAIDVFSAGIQFLKDHLTNHFQQFIHGIRDSDIHWVLTLPAIWDEAAKKFMRKSAEMAGIPSGQLTLALEPESAALYCQLGEDITGVTPMEVGEEFILLDCGGGTVDVTVHKVRPDKTLKEIHRASGGPWGGIKVNDAFQEYLMELTDYEIIDLLSKQDTLSLEKNTEKLKRTVDSSDKTYYLQIPLKFLQFLQRSKPWTIVAGKLKLPSSEVKKFFQKPIDDICEHLENILLDLRRKGHYSVTRMILVGGFAESELLKYKIQQRFSTMDIISPREPGSAVVKGAVEFGHCPEKIRYRLSPYTYGVDTAKRFVVGKHHMAKLLTVDNVSYCKDIFDIHIRKDQEVETGTSISSRSYTPLYAWQTELSVGVFETNNLNPVYIDEDGCRLLGRFSIEIPDESLSRTKRGVNVKMIFSGTELKVEARSVYTGKLYENRFEFT